MNVWERSLHSFHSVEMTIKRVDSRPVVAYPLPFEMTEGEEISPCASLRFPTCGRLPVAFRDDKREEGIVIN